MKKTTAWFALIVVIAIMVGFGYIMMYGVDEKGSGAVKNTKLGLDLAGGVSITYEVVGDEAPTQSDVDDTIEKLRKRIEKYSTESDVYQEGTNRISIEIPGVSDAEAVLADMGSPGLLYFIRPTGSDGTLNYGYMTSTDGSQVYGEDGNLFIYSASGLTYAYDSETGTVALDANGAAIPYTVKDSNLVRVQYTLTKPIEDLLADGSIVLTGTDVSVAEGGAYTDDYNVTQYIVSLTFTDEAAATFANETGAVAGKSGLYGTIAIYYDGELLSVPNVNEKISGGKAQISGMRSMNEANWLAQSIRIGGLKLELSELRSNVVGAQLGSEAIATSIKAGIVGVALIILFMIIVYRVPGFCAALALVAYTMMDLLCINFLEITMTLPGIAGIILSIGMAVDANVIIFARIREELAIGMTVESAIKSGFSKALSAILDGNITTLIAAIVLIALGSGTIKGFAYTLTLGIVLSMFTALFVTRLLLNSMYAIGFSDPKWIGKTKESKVINFVGHRKMYFGISGAILAIGIVEHHREGQEHRDRPAEQQVPAQAVSGEDGHQDPETCAQDHIQDRVDIAPQQALILQGFRIADRSHPALRPQDQAPGFGNRDRVTDGRAEAVPDRNQAGQPDQAEKDHIEYGEDLFAPCPFDHFLPTSSEQACFRFAAADPVDRHQQDRVDHRVEQVNRRGIGVVPVQQALAVDKGGNGVRCLIGGRAVEQDNLLVVDAHQVTDPHDQHDNNGGHNARNGDVQRLLPAVRAVQLRRVIQLLVNRRQGGNIDHTAVSQALPDAAGNHDPVEGSRVGNQFLGPAQCLADLAEYPR